MKMWYEDVGGKKMNQDLLLRSIDNEKQKKELQQQKRKEDGENLCKEVVAFIERNYVIKRHSKGKRNHLSSYSAWDGFFSGKVYPSISYYVKEDRVVFSEFSELTVINRNKWENDEAYLKRFITKLGWKLIRKIKV